MDHLEADKLSEQELRDTLGNIDLTGDTAVDYLLVGICMSLCARISDLKVHVLKVEDEIDTLRKQVRPY